MFLKRISEMIIITSLELHIFLKHAGCLRGGEGSPNSDNDGQEGKGGKKSIILPGVLCECPLNVP